MIEVIIVNEKIQKIIVWIMLIVILLFFVATIVWGIN